jgi:hypothetical protein
MSHTLAEHDFPAAPTHRGRPVVRHTNFGMTLLLCPAGHLYQGIASSAWSGSRLQQLYDDPLFTVECDGGS